MGITEVVIDPLSDWEDVRILSFRMAFASAPWHKVRHHSTNFKDGMLGNEVLAWIESCKLSGADSKSTAIAIGNAMLQRGWFFQLNRRSAVGAFRPTSGQLYVLSNPYPNTKLESTTPVVLKRPAPGDSIEISRTSHSELSPKKEEKCIVSSCQKKKEWALEESPFSTVLSPRNVNDSAMDSISEVSTQLDYTEDRLREFMLALQAAPWHRVWYHYTAYSAGMTGEELAAWILNTSTFAVSTQSEAHLVAESMLRHGLFFCLNRLKKVCGFSPTAAHLYVRENPWGEAVRVSIEDTLTLSIVSFEEVERRRGNGPYNPVPRSLFGVRYDSVDELQCAIVLPSVHGAVPANCEWVDEWNVVRRSGNADGWRYGVTSDTCTDIELSSKHRYRRRVWQRAARVQPKFITTGTRVLPNRGDSDTVNSLVVSPPPLGRVRQKTGSPDLRRMVLERTGSSHAALLAQRGGQLEIFVNHADLSMRYPKLYLGVVDDGPRSLQSLAAVLLTNTSINGLTTFNYEWRYRFTCESFNFQRPVTLQLFTIGDSITRIQRVVAHAELYLDGNATYGRAVLKVHLVGGANGDGNGCHATGTKESFIRSTPFDDCDGKCNGDKKRPEARQNPIGYLHLFWRLTGTLKAEEDEDKNSLASSTESLTRTMAMRLGQFAYLRVSILSGEGLPLEPSVIRSPRFLLGQCLFPQRAARARRECMFDVAYSSSLCTLSLHSPIYNIRGSTAFNGEFDWRFAVMTSVKEPVVITLLSRRRHGRVWKRVGAVCLSHADEEFESSSGAGHLRRHFLGHGSVTLIHQWLPFYHFI